MTLESIAAAIGVLALVILVHELGHFLVAKRCNTEVQVFSIGFGPKLFSFVRGETEYRISLIPVGGYVRMAGELEEFAPKVPGRGFPERPLAQRSAIVAAGPAVNLLFAFVVFTFVMLFYGKQVPGEQALIGGVLEDSPAAVGGLQTDDTVIAIDGEPISSWDELYERVVSSEGRTLALTVLSPDGETREVSVTPESRPRYDYLGEETGESYVIGVQRGLERHSVGLIEAVNLGARYTWMWTSIIAETLWRLVQGRLAISDLGGPIMIAQEAGRRAQNGLEPLLHFMALLSVNLGIINILPIPGLDGGHLLFFSFEGLRGRPMPDRARELVQQMGVLVLVALMILVVFNDISRMVGG